ncbi:MAG: hypothetical protein R3337_11050 [Gammaproteobacteria bacterium]|nr:hypothetical protein [Gammaproteobacteria bacterium]
MLDIRSRDVSRQPRGLDEVLEMWKKLAFLFSLSAAIFASSCASIDYAYYGVNGFNPEEDEAVVLVGVQSRVFRPSLLQGSKTYHLPQSTVESGSRDLDVYAMPAKPGSRFFVNHVEFSVLIGVNGEPVNTASGAKVAKFKEVQQMKVPEKKIYYYGTFVTSEKEVVLVPEPIGQIIQIAQYKYPEIFSARQRANF